MYRNTNTKEATKEIQLGCGLLFVCFCFSYLYVLQADLLALIQHLLADGQTTYSPFWGALIWTVLLLLLQVGTARIGKFPIRFHALSYFPSCLVLSAITAFEVPFADAVHIGWSWWGYAIAVLLFLAVGLFVKEFPDIGKKRVTKSALLWPNLVLFCILFVFVGMASNTNNDIHNNLRTARLLTEGMDKEALQVGKKSSTASRSMSAMRAYLLSKYGLLGENLFFFPNDHNAQSLMFTSADTLWMKDVVTMVHRHWKGAPSKRIENKATLFFEALQNRDATNTVAKDYLLSAYLLDKRLDDFALLLPKCYTVDESLPTHYKEAWLLYSNEINTTDTQLTDSLLEERYDAFMSMRSQYPERIMQANMCRKFYGNTYWWYYYFK